MCAIIVTSAIMMKLSTVLKQTYVLNLLSFFFAIKENMLD